MLNNMEKKHTRELEDFAQKKTKQTREQPKSSADVCMWSY